MRSFAARHMEATRLAMFAGAKAVNGTGENPMGGLS